MLWWCFQATKWKKLETIFKLKAHCLRNSFTVNLTAVRKFILEFNSCFGDHMFTSVPCTKRNISKTEST